MKKYAVLIAALTFGAATARADHERLTNSDGCVCGWRSWPMKADSSVRGAMTPYSTQHMILPSSSESITVYETDITPVIRADSSERGAKMPGQWQGSPASGVSSSSSYSTDLEYQAEPGVAIDNSDSFDVESDIRAQGAPNSTPDTGAQSSRDLDDSHPDLNIQSEIKAEPDRSSDYRSEQQQFESPEQGAPAATPDFGTAERKDSSLSVQGEAALQNESEKSSSQPDLNKGTPATEPYKGTANSDLNSTLDKSSGAAGVQSQDSVDSTVRPNLTENSAGEQADDLSFSEKLRTGLTTGNEGRPGSFSAATLQDVQITSHAGAVTLKGKVSSDQEKRDIEARVKEMPGVLSVNNMLEVSSGSSAITPEQK